MLSSKEIKPIQFEIIKGFVRRKITNITDKLLFFFQRCYAVLDTINDRLVRVHRIICNVTRCAQYLILSLLKNARHVFLNLCKHVDKRKLNTIKKILGPDPFLF